MTTTPRDCTHGQLARSCERCADARDISELRAEVAAGAAALDVMADEVRTLRAERQELLARHNNLHISARAHRDEIARLNVALEHAWSGLAAAEEDRDALRAALQPAALAKALVHCGLLAGDAVDDPEGYDGGATLEDVARLSAHLLERQS